MKLRLSAITVSATCVAAAWASLLAVPDLFGEIEPGVAEVVPFDGGARAYSYSVPAALKDNLQVGQLVRVVSGPFRDFSARVERLDTGGRIAVGIEIFSRITPAILEEGEIEAV